MSFTVERALEVVVRLKARAIVPCFAFVGINVSAEVDMFSTHGIGVLIAEPVKVCGGRKHVGVLCGTCPRGRYGWTYLNGGLDSEIGIAVVNGRVL